MLGRDDSGRPERQSPIIDRELHQYHVDVAALSETRLNGQGQLSEQHYTFFLSGVDLHKAGTAFAIHKDVLIRIEAAPSALSNRLLSIHIGLPEKRFLTQL